MALIVRRSKISMPKTKLLQILILALLLATYFVIPASSTGEIEDDCAEASLWTSMDAEAQSSGPETLSNVILVMLDGVRWQEVVGSPSQGTAIFPYLHSTLSGESRLFINDRVSNSHKISLPAYQSIFTGTVQSCATNNCGRVSVETFPERLVRELKLTRKQVATLASWKQIACAVESKPRATFVNAGNKPVYDGPMEAELLENNQLQEKIQWKQTLYRNAARLDEHTFRHALSYLRRHRPNFFFVSFVDSDFFAHQRDYTGYIGALRQYDRWLKELIDTLNTMGEYGRKTALIVTTDHGRGSGAGGWSEHGIKFPESERIWTYIRLPENGSFRFVDNFTSHSHIDLRPTIEVFFGLQPLSCPRCGASFVAAIDRSPTQTLKPARF